MPHNRYKEVRQGTLVTYLRAARARPNLTITRARPGRSRAVCDGDRAVGVRWIGADGQVQRIPCGYRRRRGRGLQQPGDPAALRHRPGRGAAPPWDTAEGRASGRPGAHRPSGRRVLLPRADGIAATTGRFFAANWRGPAALGPEPEWQTHPFPVDEEEGICGLWTLSLPPGLARHGRDRRRRSRAAARHRPRLPRGCRATSPGSADAWEAHQELLATAPFRRHGARWLEPELDLPAHLLANLAPAHHQSGTCRMGSDARDSVVDPDLRVHGIDRPAGRRFERLSRTRSCTTPTSPAT